mgnify:CR=1 FL=1
MDVTLIYRARTTLLTDKHIIGEKMQDRTSLPSWEKLTQHAAQMKQQHMSELFKQNPERFQQFSIQLAPFLVDYSKNLISTSTMDLLINLAKECEVEAWREKMFSGERINKTEDRAVLHTALRNNSAVNDSAYSSFFWVAALPRWVFATHFVRCRHNSASLCLRRS